MLDDNSFIQSYQENFNKKQFDTKNMISFKMNYRGEFDLDNEIIEFCEGNHISKSVMEFGILHFMNENENSTKTDLFIVTQEFVDKLFDDPNVNDCYFMKEMNIFAKKHFVYLFETTSDHWNVAIITDIHLLIKDEFLVDVNRNQNTTMPELRIILSDKNSCLQNDFYDTLFESLNKFFNQYSVTKYNEGYENVSKYYMMMQEQFKITIKDIQGKKWISTCLALQIAHDLIVNLGKLDLYFENISSLGRFDEDEIMKELSIITNSYKEKKEKQASVPEIIQPRKSHFSNSRYQQVKDEIFEASPGKKSHYSKANASDISFEEMFNEYSVKTEKPKSNFAQKKAEMNLETPKILVKNNSNSNIALTKLENNDILEDNLTFDLNTTGRGNNQNEIFNISHISPRNEVDNDFINQTIAQENYEIKTYAGRSRNVLEEESNPIQKRKNTLTSTKEKFKTEEDHPEDRVVFEEIQPRNSKIISLEIDLTKTNMLRNNTPAKDPPKPVLATQKVPEQIIIQKVGNSSSNSFTLQDNLPDKPYIKKKVSSGGINSRKTVMQVDRQAPAIMTAPARNSSFNTPAFFLRDKLSVITEEHNEDLRTSISPGGAALRKSYQVSSLPDEIPPEREKAPVINKAAESVPLSDYHTNYKETLQITDTDEIQMETPKVPHNKAPESKPKGNERYIYDKDEENTEPSFFSTLQDNGVDSKRNNRLMTEIQGHGRIDLRLNRSEIALKTISNDLNSTAIYNTDLDESALIKKGNHLEEQMKREFHIPKRKKRSAATDICLETKRILEEEKHKDSSKPAKNPECTNGCTGNTGKCIAF